MTSHVHLKTKENQVGVLSESLYSKPNTRPGGNSEVYNHQANHVTETTGENSLTLDKRTSVTAQEAMKNTAGNHGLQPGSPSMSAPHKHKSSSLRGEAGEKRVGLCNGRAMLFLILWYLFSAFTLFLNKYILSTLKGDPQLLGAMQMVMTTLCGLFQLYFPLGMYTPVHRERNPPNFWRNMILVGTMRFLTVILGLEALKYVAVSFTETVKSSAPIFTVLISRVIMNEHTGMCTALSLLPIMGGLALCSAYELSFNLAGLMAALATNLTECFQNVYSKLLISGERHSYTPAELQYYTSLSSIVILIPVASFLIDIPKVRATFDLTMFIILVFNGIFFHFQSITAYVLMDYISPVTHSVANTVKRAFLIWTSVIIFGNPVTLLSALGTVTVTVGVLLYTKAKEYDHNKEELRAHYACTIQPDGTRVI